MHSVRLVILACMTVFLVSCGFHLRGAVEVPPELKNIHISGVAEHSSLYKEIKRVVQRAGSEVSKNPAAADSQINIMNEEHRKQILAVDSLGRAAEYGLIYSFRFSVAIKSEFEELATENDHAAKPLHTKVLVPSQKIYLNRDFRFDPNNVLATEALERQVRLEMTRLSVQQMMRRIRAYLQNKDRE